MNEKQKKLLSEYLKNASMKEAQELHDLLDERENRKGPVSPGNSGLNIDVSRMAETMSKQIQEQMGLSNLNIKKMAVDMVVQMARQQQPDISERDLAALVNEMVPSGNEKRREKNIPPEILREMVQHFIRFSKGGFSEHERLTHPSGWAEKYWSNFPEKIQKLITAMLTGIIDEEQFWETFDYLLQLRESSASGKEDGGNRKAGKYQKKKTEQNRKPGFMPRPPGPGRDR